MEKETKIEEALKNSNHFMDMLIMRLKHYDLHECNQVQNAEWQIKKNTELINQSTNQSKVEESIGDIKFKDRTYLNKLHETIHDYATGIMRATFAEVGEAMINFFNMDQPQESKKVEDKEIEMPTNKEIKEIFHKEGLDSKDEVGVVVWIAYKLGYKAAFKSINQ